MLFFRLLPVVKVTKLLETGRIITKIIIRTIRSTGKNVDDLEEST